MDEPSERDRAAAELEALRSARADVVKTSGRPAWADAAAALCFGLAVWAVSPPTVTGAVIAFALFLVGIAVILRFTRRRGRLTDDRAVGLTMAAYAPFGLVVGLAGMLARDATDRRLTALVALAVALAGFAYLRIIERYQARRLAAGDHGPYDLS